MKAEDIGPAAQHVRALIRARSERRAVARAEVVTVIVSTCDNGCCQEEIEIEPGPALRAELAASADADIAAAVQALLQLGVTGTDAIGAEVGCDEDEGEADDEAEAA